MKNRPTIIKHYLSGEMTRLLLAVTVILMSIALSNQFVILITKAAGGQFAFSVLMQVLAYNVPRLLSYMLPISLFLAVLLTLGRLYTDNEMNALKALGFPLSTLVKITLTLSVVVAMIVAVSSLYMVPKVRAFRDSALKQDESKMLMQTIAPERFHSIKQGELVFYVQGLSSDKTKLSNVFIAEFPRAEELRKNKNDESNKHSGDSLGHHEHDWSVLVAKEGKIVKDNGLSYLVLSDGKRYEGLPGERDYVRVSFDTYGRLIQEEGVEVPEVMRSTSTMDLFRDRHKDLETMAELQWRISPAITCLVLGILALGLGKVSPRKGRFGKLYPSLILYIIYINLLSMCRKWLQAGWLPGWLGLWWVHILFGLFAILLLLHSEGYLNRFYASFRRQPALKSE